jgi:tetratricopeptide (TPR) repeat protein
LIRFAPACAAAIILVAAAYANSLDNSFHFDDSHVIETNLFLRSLGNVPRFFTDPNTFSSLPQNATYRPLVTLSLALDHAWGGGLAPRAFHLTQLALLLVTGALLVAFFTTLTRSRPIALFAATLFCVHTANTETMNLISARSELLSTIGLFASFLLFVHSPPARRTLLYLVPLAIGALAKAPLVVFAPLLYVYVRLYEQQPPRRALRTILPALVLGIALLVFLNAMNSPQWQSGGGSRWHYLITQPLVWLHYVRLFFLPIGLTADTDWRPFAHWYDTRAVAGYVFVALLVWLTRRAWQREELRPAAFGLAWFAIALLPTSSVFPLAEVSNEHRIFFAYIGLALAFAWWTATRTTALPRPAVAAAAVALLLAHAAGTHARNKVWKTEETLWADVVSKSPENGRAWMNYGLTGMAVGRYREAKQSFDRAARYTPNYATLEINQGVVENALGDRTSAERHFRRALQLQPDHNAHFFYARFLSENGRGPEALAHLRTAVQLSPGVPQQRALLLRLLAAAGAEAELRVLAAETRRIDPGESALIAIERRYDSYAEAFAEGLRAGRRRDWPLAAHAYRDALRHDPRSADAWNNLGWSLTQLGFRAEAARAYEQTLVLQPDYERATNNLAALRAGPR